MAQERRGLNPDGLLRHCWVVGNERWRFVKSTRLTKAWLVADPSHSLIPAWVYLSKAWCLTRKSLELSRRMIPPRWTRHLRRSVSGVLPDALAGDQWLIGQVPEPLARPHLPPHLPPHRGVAARHAQGIRRHGVPGPVPVPAAGLRPVWRAESVGVGPRLAMSGTKPRAGRTPTT